MQGIKGTWNEANLENEYNRKGMNTFLFLNSQK